MRLSRYLLVIILAISGLGMAQEVPVYATQNEPEDNQLGRLAESIEKLQVDSAAARQTAAKEISEYRRTVIRKLMDIMSSSATAPAKVEAIHLLGEYRAKEAVNLLVDNFLMGVTVHIGSMVSQPDLLPAGDALVQIGEPSIPAVLSKVAAANDKDRRSAYMYILIDSRII